MRLTVFLSILLIVPLSLSCTGSGAVDEEPDVPAIIPSDSALLDIRADLQELVKKGDYPSFAVAVSLKGETLWLEGIGYADVEAGIAATPQTVYPLASTSKSISATLLFSLMEKKGLTLETPVNPLIVPFELDHVQQGDVTLRDIIAMKAGIPHGWFGALSYDRIPAEETLFDWYGRTAFPPGRLSHYSNWSAGLSQPVIEQVSGMSYEAYARQELFDPLGMDLAATRLTERQRRNLAKGYTSSMRPVPPDEDGVSVPAGGLGMYASINDMLRFGIFHAGTLTPGDAPLSAETLSMMNEAERTGPTYALGWHRVSLPLVSNGNTGTTATELRVYPEQGLVISVLTNRGSWDMKPGAIADEISHALIGDVSSPYDLDFEDYVAEYETPYDVEQSGLAGQWQGVLSTPLEDGIPATLSFKQDGTVTFTYRDTVTVELEDLVYNRQGEFTGAAIIEEFPLFRPGEDPEAGLLFQLYRDTPDSLIGYIRMDRAEADYWYALPVIAEFRRQRASANPQTDL